jgi:SulP family sulfate permease
VDVAALRARGITLSTECRGVSVAYVVGPLFFAAVGSFNEAFASLEGVRTLVLSLRGVPLVDTSGLQALLRLHERLESQGGHLLLAAVHPQVLANLERSGLLEALGDDALHASADQAILAADRRAQRIS